MKILNRLLRYHRLFWVVTVLALIGGSVTISCKDTASTDDILKKMGAAFFRDAVSSAKSIDELSKRLGLTPDEVRQVSRQLEIDITSLEPVVVEKKPALVQKEQDTSKLVSVQKLQSKDYEPDLIFNYRAESPYVLIVEKSVHTIYVLKYEDGVRTFVAAFDCKTGRQQGDKKTQGDLKTPEGIFFFTTRHSRDEIKRMVGSEAYQYGEMAFVTDYPNYIDRLNNKNGGGIWLHGTDEPFSETSALDTQGCVVTTNENIKKLSPYIQLYRTPMIIVETLLFLPADEHAVKSAELQQFLNTWRTAWLERNLDDYIGFYSKSFEDNGKNIGEWRSYKSRIFQSVTINRVDLENVCFLAYRDGMVTLFTQQYAASNLSSTSKKALYWNREQSSWKIIAERIRN